MRLFRRTFFALTALAAVTGFCSLAFADDGKQSIKATATETAANAEDQYRVPDGGVKELLAFIKKWERAWGDDEKGYAALQEALAKVQSIAKEEDRKLDGFNDATGMWLYHRALSMDDPQLAHQEREQRIAVQMQVKDDLKKYLETAAEPAHYAVITAQSLPRHFERLDQKNLARDACREIAAVVAKNENEVAVKLRKSMEGKLRMLDLPGNPMEITGTTMKGDKFDWANYQGKVVLVDIWATWCGPCIAETPNIKNAYEKYHERGFDVLGISIDMEREALETYLKEKEIPWTTLYDGKWDENETVLRYGINSIPQMILVGKDGKVLSTNARGKELTALLEKEFPAE